jgi:hypothetical protein
MKKVAVIIKHIFRDYDYRVDIHVLPEGKTERQLYQEIQKTLLGPFEIISITDRVSEHGN